MIFREIARLIEIQTGWTAGKKLQVGHIVQNADVRMTLIQESGGKPEFTPNEDMVEMNIQALTRAETYFEAHDDAWALYKAIHGLSGMNMPRIDGSGEDYLAMTIEAIYAPQYIGEDVDRRHVFSTNYIFRMEEGGCSGTSS
jgi:hypothetical protein